MPFTEAKTEEMVEGMQGHEHDEDEHDEDEHDEHEEHEENDEHVWLSLKNVEIFCNEISAVLQYIQKTHLLILKNSLPLVKNNDSTFR